MTSPNEIIIQDPNFVSQITPFERSSAPAGDLLVSYQSEINLVKPEQLLTVARRHRFGVSFSADLISPTKSTQLHLFLDENNPTICNYLLASKIHGCKSFKTAKVVVDLNNTVPDGGMKCMYTISSKSSTVFIYLNLVSYDLEPRWVASIICSILKRIE